jgi:acyl-CoA dehydrogenase
VTAPEATAATRGTPLPSAQAALEIVTRSSAELTREATRADQAGCFPARSIELLRGHGLLAAGVPRQYGGHGLDADSLAAVAGRLAGYCGSTAMIWAMHHIQVACLARCAPAAPAIADHLRAVAREQHLIASVTSEAGTGGDLRHSRAALQAGGAGAARLEKRATTISYGAQAGSFLITVRRDEQAVPGDQVLVLVPAAHATLEQTGPWNVLGMRGTCSPAFLVSAVIPPGHVLPEPFARIASRCMIPLSHLLWSAVWAGIAADAARRAAACRRAAARSAARSGGHAADPRVGQMYLRLAQIRDSVHRFSADYARWSQPGHDADDVEIAIRANALKTSVSTGATSVAEMALQICGMAGYSEEGEFSVARQLRDLHSASLMISNARLDLANSELLLLREAEFRS